MRPNKGAGSFDPGDPAVRRVVAKLERRIGEACPEKMAEAAEHLGDLSNGWRAEAERCREVPADLRFEARDKAYERLLRSHEDGGSLDGRPPWETLHSMRNVESPAVLRVR